MKTYRIFSGTEEINGRRFRSRWRLTWGRGRYIHHYEHLHYVCGQQELEKLCPGIIILN